MCKLKKIIGRFDEQIYAIVRIVVGLLFMCHGAQKTLGFLGGVDGSGGTIELVSIIGLAGVIELVGGLLIMIGLLTSWAAFVSSGLMASAYFMAHASQGFWPIDNGGELAAVYSLIFLAIAARGAGTWSLASTLKKGSLQ
jgi:putative oxidoreductase